jgi:hypothetical protein
MGNGANSGRRYVFWKMRCGNTDQVSLFYNFWKGLFLFGDWGLGIGD